MKPDNNSSHGSGFAKHLRQLPMRIKRSMRRRRTDPSKRDTQSSNGRRPSLSAPEIATPLPTQPVREQVLMSSSTELPPTQSLFSKPVLDQPPH